MLEQLRNLTKKSAFSYILVALLIVIFAIYFGVPTDGIVAQTGPTDMARVSGQTIHDRDVNLVYNRFWGGQRDSTDEEAILVQRAMALRMVMLVHLLADKAHQAGLRVDDKEFQDYILDPYRNMEFRFAYGSTGSFDGTHYKNYVQNYLRANIANYEEFKRKELLARKYMALIEMQVNASPQEIKEIHELRNTKVNLEVVQFTPDSVRNTINIGDDEIQSYLAKNMADVEKNYQNNIEEYQTPEQVLLRRVFIPKADSNASADEKSAVVAKFESAKNRIMEKNEDFGQVASELSEDYARENQGLMDWSTLDNLDQNIVQAIDGLGQGEVKEIETEFAMMLVRIEERKEAITTPLNEVQNDIARRMIQREKTATFLAEASQKFLEQAKHTESLEAALNQLKETEEDGPWQLMEMVQTGLFSQEPMDMSSMFGNQFPGMQLGSTPWNQIPRLGRSSEISIDAFALSEDNPFNGKIYDYNSTKVIIRLVEREEPEELTDDVKAQLATEIRNQKTNKLLGSWARIFAEPSDDYGQWMEQLYEDALSSGTLTLLERNNPVASYVANRPKPASLLTGK